VLRFDDVVLNEDTHEVRRGSERIVLTRTEFALLSFFMRNPRRVLSKHQIMDAVWANDATIDPNVVETYVSYLRKKLGTDRPQLIQTIRLVGTRSKNPRVDVTAPAPACPRRGPRDPRAGDRRSRNVFWPCARS